jgi:hypothetical protein
MTSNETLKTALFIGTAVLFLYGAWLYHQPGVPPPESDPVEPKYEDDDESNEIKP